MVYLSSGIDQSQGLVHFGQYFTIELYLETS